ncbi:epoxide hydrolase N-terminal domain-containing protein [Kribbella sandramycini]|uniref:epoxide hydrolase N-terminal domain-containing protein n=1 Tax=Kribbella sandramycini TaxID=60450 RepID=UPI001EE2BFE0|nr:epoxide hydrolase N-terminal domain-containing protein [Kribbella sandramycini]
MAITTQAPAATDSRIRPFRIDVPQADLDDLRARLKATRWPDKETVAGCTRFAPVSAPSADRSPPRRDSCLGGVGRECWSGGGSGTAGAGARAGRAGGVGRGGAGWA